MFSEKNEHPLDSIEQTLPEPQSFLQFSAHAKRISRLDRCLIMMLKLRKAGKYPVDTFSFICIRTMFEFKTFSNPKGKLLPQKL